MYESGQGVEQDTAQALEWYRKAAEQEDGKAQIKLGEIYRDGQGVEQDNAQAIQWYRKAAERGIVKAQESLATLYEKVGNYTEAGKWHLKVAERHYKLAQGGNEDERKKLAALAEQENAAAQFLLGAFYVQGKGIVKECVLASYTQTTNQGSVSKTVRGTGAQCV